MSAYGAEDGLHICVMSRRYAKNHTRRVHNVPDNVGLGWKPYTVIVTSYGGVAHTAFHSIRELKRWLGSEFRVSLTGPWNAQGMRAGRISVKPKPRIPTLPEGISRCAVNLGYHVYMAGPCFDRLEQAVAYKAELDAENITWKPQR